MAFGAAFSRTAAAGAGAGDEEAEGLAGSAAAGPASSRAARSSCAALASPSALSGPDSRGVIEPSGDDGEPKPGSSVIELGSSLASESRRPFDIA